MLLEGVFINDPSTCRCAIGAPGMRRVGLNCIDPERGVSARQVGCGVLPGRSANTLLVGLPPEASLLSALRTAAFVWWGRQRFFSADAEMAFIDACAASRRSRCAAILP